MIKIDEDIAFSKDQHGERNMCMTGLDKMSVKKTKRKMRRRSKRQTLKNGVQGQHRLE